MTTIPSFYALAPQWFKADRFYKIYVTPDMLCGAWIAGQFFDDHVTRLQLIGFYHLLGSFVRRLRERREQREKLYDAFDLTAPSFLTEDQRNFRILRSDIKRIALSPKGSWWTWFYNKGSLEIELNSGVRHRFLLIGADDMGAISQLLQVSYTAPQSAVSESSTSAKENPYAACHGSLH